MIRNIARVFILLAGLFLESKACNFTECHSLKPDETKLHRTVTSETLKEDCLLTEPYMNCLTGTSQRCPDLKKDPQHYSYSNPKVSKMNAVQGLLDYFSEVCDENSDFHKAYIENAECITIVALHPSVQDICHAEAQKLYVTYIVEKRPNFIGLCFLAGHVYGCISHIVGDICGENGKDTFIRQLQLSRTLKYNSCTEQEFSDLRNIYIELMDLDNKRRRSFDKTFDLM